ncbi:MAG: hypothetical protein QOI21_1562 [Actinomycetota bacterium]|jgi:hypothetical protein|nr:hypothetical protein [Actinomycetota bacterium]
MSPVSRTRKSKKSKQKGPARSVARPNRTHTRPDWFDAAVGNVIEGAPVLMEARGPRELEQATAELLGAELAFRIEHENQGLNFHGLSEDIVDEATTRIKKSAAAQDDGWEVPLRLLHGLNSLGTPALETATRAGLRGAAKWLRRVPAARQTPEWLTQRVEATSEVWEMRDAYGLRIAVIAGFAYPEATDPSVFLFDIEAGGILAFASAGVYDDVEQAADAWRKFVGDTGADARPVRVDSAEQLTALAPFIVEERTVMGDESRNLMDNWFRARRRVRDLDAVLTLPRPESPYGVDVCSSNGTRTPTALCRAWTPLTGLPRSGWRAGFLKPGSPSRRRGSRPPSPI